MIIFPKKESYFKLIKLKVRMFHCTPPSVSLCPTGGAQWSRWWGTMKHTHFQFNKLKIWLFLRNDNHNLHLYYFLRLFHRHKRSISSSQKCQIEEESIKCLFSLSSTRLTMSELLSSSPDSSSFCLKSLSCLFSSLNLRFRPKLDLCFLCD